MHKLRKNRNTTRVARRRRGRKTRRRDLSKLIPSADSDFAFTAWNFLTRLEAQRDQFDVPELEIELLGRAVRKYRSALAKATHRNTRTAQATLEKNSARKEAEEQVRLVANMVRSSPYVEPHLKALLRLKVQPKRKRPRTCPKRPPVLEFLGSGDGVAQEAGTGGGSGMHVLRFWDHQPPVIGQRLDRKRKSKPEGAVRLELFVDLVPPGEPVPQSPFDRVREGRGFPWYLRSFTKNPIEVQFPIPAQPMLVVYWGRWADSSGETSAFLKTCVARIEGWTQHAPATALPERAPAVVVEHLSRPVRQIDAKCLILGLPYAEMRALPEGENYHSIEIA